MGMDRWKGDVPMARESTGLSVEEVVIELVRNTLGLSAVLEFLVQQAVLRDGNTPVLQTTRFILRSSRQALEALMDALVGGEHSFDAAMGELRDAVEAANAVEGERLGLRERD